VARAVPIISEETAVRVAETADTQILAETAETVETTAETEQLVLAYPEGGEQAKAQQPGNLPNTSVLCTAEAAEVVVI